MQQRVLLRIARRRVSRQEWRKIERASFIRERGRARRGGRLNKSIKQKSMVLGLCVPRGERAKDHKKTGKKKIALSVKYWKQGEG